MTAAVVGIAGMAAFSFLFSYLGLRRPRTAKLPETPEPAPVPAQAQPLPSFG